VLPLDWSDVDKKTARVLAASKANTVIGADLVYSPEAAQMIAETLVRVLPASGKAYFVLGARHRPNVGEFSSVLRAHGFAVEKHTFPDDSPTIKTLHHALGTAEEADQSFHGFVVHKNH
jgi:hypothetical protein